MPKPLKIFVLYHPRDEKYYSELWVSLRPLERPQSQFEKGQQPYIELWDHKKIELGKEREEEIENNLNRSDIFLPFISPDILGCDYMHNLIVKAFKLKAQNKIRIIPFKVRPCYYLENPLDTLQGLPRNQVPVSIWSDKDSAFESVAKEISIISKKYRTLQYETHIENKKTATIKFKLEIEDVIEIKTGDQTINSIIVDNEKYSIDLLGNMLEKNFPDIKIVETFQSNNKAYDYLREHKPDLSFLDIQTLNLNRIKQLHKLSYNHNMIFTTSDESIHRVYFEIRASYYLFKPFNYKHLEEAVNKATKEMNKNTLKKIRLSQICYCKSNGENVNIKLIDGSSIKSVKSLKSYENMLPEMYFFRCDELHLVSIYGIKEFNEENLNVITMKDGTTVTIPEDRKKDFLDFLKKFKYAL